MGTLYFLSDFSVNLNKTIIKVKNIYTYISRKRDQSLFLSSSQRSKSFSFLLISQNSMETELLMRKSPGVRIYEMRFPGAKKLVSMLSSHQLAMNLPIIKGILFYLLKAKSAITIFLIQSLK